MFDNGVKETLCAHKQDHLDILKAIDTSEYHYVKVPENHIVIDFDMKDEQGGLRKGTHLYYN